MRNYVSSTFEKWYIAIYVMKLEKSHLTGPIRVVPELTPLSLIFLIETKDQQPSYSENAPHRRLWLWLVFVLTVIIRKFKQSV